MEELLRNENYTHNFVPYFENISNDICYWRKCWGFRDTVMAYLGNKYDEIDGYEYRLDAEDIDKIIDILFDIAQHPDHWESPVWSWVEYLNNNMMNLANILRLREDIRHGFIDLDIIGVIWYDSY